MRHSLSWPACLRLLHGNHACMNHDSYSIYTRAFSKVASGAKLTDADFGSFRFKRLFKPFDQAGQVAVALAVQDVNKDFVLRSKADFDAEMQRLLA